MSVPRFFHPEKLGPGAEVALGPDATHHAARVLRLQQGNAVVLFDGRGGEFPAVIIEIGKQGVTAQTAERLEIEREAPLHIVLAQGISSGEKMDFTLQKAVELGAAALQPLAVKRSVVKLCGERAQKRVAHWQKVAIAACEQCGRNRVPEVLPIVELTAWLASQQNKASLRLLLSPRAEKSLRDFPPQQSEVVLLAGPEGGLAPEEEAAALAAGFNPVRLGPRVLRTETAALAMLSAMQTAWGDF